MVTRLAMVRYLLQDQWSIDSGYFPDEGKISSIITDFSNSSCVQCMWLIVAQERNSKITFHLKKTT